MTPEKMRERLRVIEEDLDALRRELGPPTEDPKDFGDAGADLAARGQQLGMIESLEAERDKLLEELGEL